jgi:hypothetical protein
MHSSFVGRVLGEDGVPAVDWPFSFFTGLQQGFSDSYVGEECDNARQESGGKGHVSFV